MNFKLMLLSRKYRAEDPGTGDPAGGGGSTPTEPVNTDMDWGALAGEQGSGHDDGDDFLAAVDEPSVPAEPTPAQPAPAEPATPPAAPVAEPAVPAQPPTEPAQPPQPAEPVQPTQPADGQLTAEQLEAARTDYFNSLVQEFQILPEDAARLQTEPENVLPVLAARVQMSVLDAVFSTLPQRVHAMIGLHMKAVERENSAQDAMFSAYPELKNHRDAVLRVGQMYRAANPKATREQAIKAIGDFVMQSLGLTRAAPAAPAQQPAPTQPFVPATGGGPASFGTPPAGEWDFLDDED
jgi:hypothetical protein